MAGQIHLYTGNGKGKTTASLGITFRALGAGFKIFFGQFAKGRDYSEIKMLESFPEQLIHRQFGNPEFIFTKAKESDIELAKAGLEECKKALTSGDYNMVVMDEVCIALYYKLFTEEELISVLESRADNVEVILTGRKATDSLIEFCDLVTEMKEVKHYYTKGIPARKGIED